jgi:Flp pilus assembly protein TadG
MRNSERGSALLEFGIVAIMLFAMIFGIIDFSRALCAYHFVASAARDGSRYASVRGADCNPTWMSNCDDPVGMQSYLLSTLQAQAAGTGMDRSQISVQQPTYSGTSGDANTCPTTTINHLSNPGCNVAVTVSYKFTFLFPLLPAIPLNMSSTSTTVITQ